MPISTVNWLWMGNHSMLDPTPNTSITVPQRQAIVGYEAEGNDQLKAVAVTGSYTMPPNTAFGFVTQWAATSYADYVPTAFSYTLGDVQVSDARAISAFAVTMRIQTGIEPDVFQDQSATLVQMSNGDLFFRPHVNAISAWSGITRVHGIEVVAVNPDVSASYAAFSHTVSFQPEIFEVAFPCFAAGTLIDTIDGPVPVERLAVGSLVRTAGGRFQPVRWIGRRKLDRIDLACRPDLKPVRIGAGALGPGLPRRDLLVSPQHRVLVRSRIARRMFAADEVLVAARHLAGLEGIAVQEDCRDIEYVHFMCDRHEIVLAEGAATETLYAGPQAMTMLPPSARDEILSLFPELTVGGACPARPLATGRQGRRLAHRHLLNGRPLVDDQPARETGRPAGASA